MSFDEVSFPEKLAIGTAGGPEFSTDVITVASGAEKRQANWSEAMLRFDVATAVKKQADLDALVAFFYARRGRARGFRFQDFSDFSSNGSTGTPTATDQTIGTGDGSTQIFQLQKTYSDGLLNYSRTIRKPVSGSVLISVNDAAQGSGFTIDHTTGEVTFDTAPGNGDVIKAGFYFDVPVRFDTDYLESSLAAYTAYQTAEVPLKGLQLGG